ncbi:MAG: glutamate--tRNA ligase [Candidatus Omnitrophica bacterium]|nr:glutamate--tRNA ligase [Candidatus Omnitrophota bacterium]
MITVRFAPSPTGFLHVGGARTALFNFLFARNQKGKFLLRIEDTDRERSRPEFEKEILDSLKWLGLGWDETPLRQSERISIYQKEAEKLLSGGLAYEEVKEGKRAVIFKMPRREIALTDLLRGEVRFDTRVFEDLVLLKSDGFPTYHWACVVDDEALGVTHVIRGEDHLTNTPKQMLLLEALGWRVPAYAHLPLILGSDGTPLSKRHGAVSVAHYLKEGFLPEGLVNYLALLGWGAEGNREFFTLPELVEKFSLKRLIRSSARFDLEKLRWTNAQHLRALPETDYLRRASDWFQSENLIPAGFPEARLQSALLLFRSRIQTFKDLGVEAPYFFRDVESYDLEAMNRSLGEPGLKEKLLDLKAKFEALPDFGDVVKLEAVLREGAQKTGVEAKVLIHPLRLALTGKGVSPGIFELMKALGKDVCLERLGRLLEKL